VTSSAPASAPVVILGGGFAGLCAAAALDGAVSEIVLVERDVLPDVAEPRRGVPQGGQLHNLLGRAQASLEELVPGFVDSLVAAGCAQAVVAQETEVFDVGQRMPRRDVGLRIVSAPQPTIEHALRTWLRTRPRVTVLDGTSCESVSVDEGRVTAVQLRSADGATQDLATSVVVDATGASTRCPIWLRELGISQKTTTVRSDQWYVSITLDRPATAIGDPTFYLNFPQERSSRGALLSPSGAGHWCLSVNGRSDVEAPTTFEGMVSHCRQLGDQGIAEAIDGARPIGEPERFRRLVATWRRFDDLVDPVIGLLPMGDSFATLNPLFGQGMSVAAWQAVALLRLVGEHGLSFASTGALTRAYLARAAECIGAAWDLGVAVEAFFDSVGGEVVGPRFVELLEDDADLHGRYVRMWHLLEPASILDHHLAERLMAVSG